MDRIYKKIEEEINNNKNEHTHTHTHDHDHGHEVKGNKWRNDKFSKIKNSQNNFDLNSS